MFAGPTYVLWTLCWLAFPHCRGERNAAPAQQHPRHQAALLIVWPAEGYVVFWFLLGSVDESEEPLSHTPERSFGSKLETKRVRRCGCCP